ncbi:MAG: SPASM domain-containing protein [Saprospiraceae bacterium]
MKMRLAVESGLSRLIISVDGASQEVYEQYRVGGNLQTVLDGARNLVAWKKRLNKSHPYIVFQVLVVRPNEHELEDLRKLAKDIGVDEIKFKSAQVYDYKNGNPLIPANKQYARYVELEDGTWKPKHALKPYCWKMWHAAVITWNGMVVPCCFDKDASHQMGTLQTTSFEAIWKGEPYTTFRETLATGRDQIDICTNCSEGCSVWV